MDTDIASVLITTAVALACAVAAVVVARIAIRSLSRRWSPAESLEEHGRPAFRVLVLLIAVNPVVADLRGDSDSAAWDVAATVARLLVVLATGWLLTVVLLFLVDIALTRNSDLVGRADNKAARRVRTQVMILRRVVYALGTVVTFGAALLTLPGVGAFGASVLASAGLISVVAAVAAGSVLGNVFAGLQIAFSDSIRIDDAVIVESEWGWIEEITLTYVVVRLWDERRMVLPSSYFTTTPFQNWTRETSQLLGAVELDLDWRVDTTAIRTEVDRVLESTDLWDGRAKVVQVTDAVGGFVRVRVLVTAVDAPTLFDLRCLVRERLVAWVRENADSGMPRTRAELVSAPTSAVHAEEEDAGGLYHGDAEADARAVRAGGGRTGAEGQLDGHDRDH
ncbi:mechanosensitive ion channel [soil metagenome]